MAGKYPAPGTPFAVSPGSFHPDTIKPAEKSLTFVSRFYCANPASSIIAAYFVESDMANSYNSSGPK